MFRGLHISEARLLFGLIATLFIGMVFHQTQIKSEKNETSLAGEMPAISLSVPEKNETKSPRTLGVIDVNKATLEELDLLPGIGPAKATAIINTRDRHGRFNRVEDLLEVSGIGEKTLERLRPYVMVEQPTGMSYSLLPVEPQPGRADSTPLAMEKVHLNRADSKELQRLNGVGPKLAQRILEDRQQNGPYYSGTDLLRVKGIGPKTLEKNQQLLAFD